MQKRLLRWELIGFAFTVAVGTLLHFVYEWTGGNPLIAAFCAVNESTWEHMKLLFVPFFLFTMVEFIVFAEPLRSFFAAKAASILLGLLAIPVLFYSLGGMFGKTPDWVNIAIFFLADALLYFMSFRLLTRGALRGGAWQLAGFLLLWLRPTRKRCSAGLRQPVNVPYSRPRNIRFSDMLRVTKLRYKRWRKPIR